MAYRKHSRKVHKKQSRRTKKQRGGNGVVNGVSKYADSFPKPLIAQGEYGSARANAYHRMMNNDNVQADMINHRVQLGGAVDPISPKPIPVPLPPTYGVPQGPGHMNSNNQTTSNMNSHLQAEANRQYDSLVEPPQTGGRHHRGGKYSKNKRRSLRKVKSRSKSRKPMRKTRKQMKKSRR